MRHCEKKCSHSAASPRTRLLAVLLAMASASAASSAWATDYYISYSSGNDNNAGTSLAPWKSLGRLKQTGFKLNANDKVLLLCGDTWRETLSLSKANVLTTPVSVGSYGSACDSARPQINGAALLSSAGWSFSAQYPDVYEYNYADPSAQAIAPKGLVVNGVPMRPARYPAAGYIPIAANSDGRANHLRISASNDAQVRAMAGSAAAVVGAEINIRTDRWLIETKRIVAYTPDGDGADIELDSGVNVPVKKDFGLYFSNRSWMLGAEEQWYYDATSGKLFFRPAVGSSIPSLAIEAIQRDESVSVSYLSDVQVAGLEVVNSGKYGIIMLDTPNARVVGNRVSVSGETGIGIMDGSVNARARDNVTVQGNIVGHAKVYGIRSRVAYGLSTLENLVEDTGIALGPISSPNSIGINGQASITADNVVRRSAYVGIGYRNLSGNQVERNLVEDSCQLLSDCGAIYTYNVGVSPSLQSGLVKDNLIVRVNRAIDGTPQNTTNTRAIATGIYFDEETSNVSAAHNSVFGAELGILLHRSSNIASSQNTLLNIGDTCFMLDSSDTGNSYSNNECLAGGVVYGNPSSFANNAPVRSAVGVSLQTSLNYLISLAGNVFSGNVYNGVYAPVVYAIVNNADASNNGTLLSQAQWSQIHGGNDALNAPVSFGLNLFYPVGPAYPELIQNGKFDSGVSWSYWSANSANPATVAVLNDANCKTPPCSKFTAQTGGDIMKSNTVPVALGNMYVLSYDLKSPDVNASVSLTLRYASGNYAARGFNRREWLAPEWRRYSVPFYLSSSDAPTRLDIYGIPTKNLLVDNVSLKQVDSISFADPMADMVELVNASDAPLGLSCPIDRVASCSGYVLNDGSAVNWPVSLGPWEVKALVRMPTP